jgi:TatD DNase family protein
MHLLDTHAHLTMAQFDPDREAVIQRALDSGLRSIITIGITLDDARRAVELTERYPLLSAAVGIHPHHVQAVKETTYPALEKLLAHPKVVALGEIGLDYYRNYAPRDIQQREFINQISLARKWHLPIIIHNRDAHQDILDILRREGGKEVGGIFHCFSGTAEVARAVLDLGFYISIAGPITYQNARKLPEVVSIVPLDRLLIETDCPYLPPHPFRDQRNEPAYVRLVAERIAALKGISVASLADAMTENVSKLLGIVV